jgi:hypothetical protein
MLRITFHKGDRERERKQHATLPSTVRQALNSFMDVRVLSALQLERQVLPLALTITTLSENYLIICLFRQKENKRVEGGKKVKNGYRMEEEE